MYASRALVYLNLDFKLIKYSLKYFTCALQVICLDTGVILDRHLSYRLRNCLKMLLCALLLVSRAV